MIAILSLLLIVSLSFLIVRIGAVALTMTGLSDEIARFQALSAFTGAGFTTGESENVVNGPARRRIISWLIRLGSAGVVTAISTLMLSFVGEDRTPTIEKLLILLAGIAAIAAAARSRRLDRLTRPVIERMLRRSSTLDLRDYAGLLHLREDWRVVEVEIHEGSWLAGGALGDLELAEEGVAVLGIERTGGRFEGGPSGASRAEPGDTVILYGRSERLQEIAERPRDAEAAHREAEREARAHGDRLGAIRDDGAS